MPTYVYKREDGSTFEIVQSIKDDALEVCPTTDQKVKRIITAVTSVIKGYSADKERRSQERKQANPYGTTLPEYQKIIDENTAKAREAKGKAGLI